MVCSGDGDSPMTPWLTCGTRDSIVYRWASGVLSEVKPMRYLTRQEIDVTLRRGKGVAQICRSYTHEGQPAIQYIVIYLRSAEVELWMLERYDDGNKDFADIVEFGEIDPDNSPVISKFSTVEEAIGFAVATYDARGDRFLNESMLGDAYLEFRGLVSASPSVEEDDADELIDPVAECTVLYLKIAKGADVTRTLRCLRRYVDIPITELAERIRRGALVRIGDVPSMYDYIAEPKVFGLISDVRALGVPHQWYMGDVPWTDEELSERIRTMLKPKDECHTDE